MKRVISMVLGVVIGSLMGCSSTKSPQVSPSLRQSESVLDQEHAPKLSQNSDLYKTMVLTDQGKGRTGKNLWSEELKNLDRTFTFKNLLVSAQSGKAVCKSLSAEQAAKGLDRFEGWLSAKAKDLGSRMTTKEQKDIENMLKSCEVKCKCQQWIAFVKEALPANARQKTLQLELLRAEFKVQKLKSIHVEQCAQFNTWACETKLFKSWTL